MKSKLFIAKLTMTSLAICLFFTSVEAVPVFADSFKSVTLGADLSEAQKQEMLKAFGVTKNSANILEVTSKEEHTYLAKVASEAQLGNKAISCSYVEPTEKGGLNVSTNNLTWVNDGMIKNALITAGIENANVKASAPFEVSGTAALTGILKGFENTSTGKKIDENKKEAANEELITTGDVGEKIGQNDASNLMNNIKKDVIKDKPKTKEELNKIVDKATNEYKDKLTDKDIENIRNVMSKINDLDLNYNNLKDQMNDITNQLKDKLNTKEAQGFFARLEEMFADFLDSVKSLF
ncbi:uncharacterized protein YpuA (DUF1002 family) [Clostridium saccharoperbutylacetonicum]|jgi:uncharacterized protein YpuA (DUF1002 family)|uniref:DUF1002 domain-containing protein n=1 Tax=Clostridium saccharoperbutylacetonicum N1-4(HMT) TaxID=931276 RepID=M1MVA7_9CLOT|nr:DUF1002 domain-containing protein [Clostridium saccharoperbutylacetonicum]AGF55447.1 hypothetical protein Cspa_c16770 [Clostridium saccharoperbutylacetonicum N1-4(HMT)]NRT63838.1 uncharacterized protein YpuA (DUF1002 family) [Clostridium saccharoperbutylacetonicum]NSB27201.1 uncharacterized protein YpuA (DUF1002 family) [Clostridium saccharoperbutylacetonicum]NSB40688.1 uncharacterized protein YpuA (DUF1002 family) [Clostridium saccharoperbutylacetonicum]